MTTKMIGSFRERKIFERREAGVVIRVGALRKETRRTSSNLQLWRRHRRRPASYSLLTRQAEVRMPNPLLRNRFSSLLEADRRSYSSLLPVMRCNRCLESRIQIFFSRANIQNHSQSQSPELDDGTHARNFSSTSTRGVLHLKADVAA